MASAPFNTTIDNLVYSYGPTNKNELRRVADGTNAQGFKNGSNTDDDYAYDANGNLTIDKNKGITGISYNQLNLPVKIEFGTNKIEYLYNATGQKVQKKVTQGSTITTTDYFGGFQYNGTVLDFFPHAEGYIKRETTGVYTYVFNYTDHLGNVRVSYKKNGSTLQILEESNYYPFGLKHEPNTVVNNQPSYKYKYNGKELQDELGLNMYDYGARNYDTALGRWMNIDPKAETSRRWSPYQYVYNNPMRFIDPDGMQAYDPGDKFASLRAAAKDFGKQYNGLSISYNKEIGTTFYKSKDADGKEFYSYTVPIAGGSGGLTPDPSAVKKGDEIVADGHTHGGARQTTKIGGKDYSDDVQFSPEDLDVYNNVPNEEGKGNAYGKKIIGIMISPDGGMSEYVPGKAYKDAGEDIAGNTIKGYDVHVAKDMPSDPAIGTARLNNIAPNVMPNVLPKNFDPKKDKKRDGY